MESASRCSVIAPWGVLQGVLLLLHGECFEVFYYCSVGSASRCSLLLHGECFEVFYYCSMGVLQGVLLLLHGECLEVFCY